MMRKIAIGLAAAAIVMAGPTLGASAKGGGGAGDGAAHVSGGGGGTHIRGGGGPAFAERGRAMGPRAYGFAGREHERRYDHRRPYRYGYYKSYPYAYGGSCWTRVWTPEGWTSKYICGPSYGYRYGYYRPHYEHRYGHHRPSYGHRYGRY